MKRFLSRLSSTLVLALVAVVAEPILLRLAAEREVSMTLLAAGGALPSGPLALAAATMIVRLAVRLVVPALVVQAIVLWLWDRRATKPGEALTRPAT